MYMPPAFSEHDRQAIFAMIRDCRLANLVSAAPDGPFATPLPLFLDAEEGEFGTLYGHVARANPHWQMPVTGDALAIFMGPDAYVTPSFYASKVEHGKVVPTWNYVTVQARGPLEFFDDAARKLDVVTRLTNIHESERQKPWAVGDAPAAFIDAQLRGIVGLRLEIKSLEGKRKMSQNRNAADRAGVATGLGQSEREMDRVVSTLIPK
jgi:transcriptional regulator